jgi:hypothetical protein
VTVTSVGIFPRKSLKKVTVTLFPANEAPRLYKNVTDNDCGVICQPLNFASTDCSLKRKNLSTHVEREKACLFFAPEFLPQRTQRNTQVDLRASFVSFVYFRVEPFSVLLCPI